MNNEKQKIVPELRFPEFENDGEWKKDSLGNRGAFTGGGTPSKNNDAFWQGNIPWVSSSDIYDETIHKIDISRFITEEAIKKSATKVVAANSLLIVSRVGVGKIAVSTKEICTSQDFTNFTPEKDDLVFLGYYLKSRSKILLSFSQGMAIKGFTKDDITNLELNFPQNPKEQQKIANCLSSLDNLITAESEKLDHLKDHKKGLLQQLFPAKGETKPQFRFPEFVGDGEWEEKKLDDIANVVASGDLDSSRFSSVKTDIHIYPIYSNSVSKEGLYGFSSFSKYKGNSVTITARGTLGKAFYRASDFVGIGRLLVISNFKEIDSIFFKENWNYYAQIHLENGGIPQLTAVKAKLTTLLYPDIKEQQKIANCLSSVDDLIEAQTTKIEALKEHKKGLMQQLFPNVNTN